MADRNRGWTTVGYGLPGTDPGRSWECQLEQMERRAIESWDGDEHWPGIDKPLFSGPDAKRFDARLAKIEDLGYGAFGRVEKVFHDKIFLARKRIKRRRGFTIEDLRQEGLTMRKLNHRHVVKVVATYAPQPYELCLLIWPAAVCNLTTLLEDIEYLRLGEGDRDDIVGRLKALDLSDLSAIEPPSTSQHFQSDETCPFDFLRTVMGCAACAMAHCHANDVRHLDIKPSNILLKPGRVYLADFGISRDVSGQDQTTTDGLPGTERWRAPELYGDHGSSMQLSDMYSLGLVYLNIATVLYNARLADFDDVLAYTSRKSREEQLGAREDKIRGHLEKLATLATATPPFMFTHEGQETVRPRPVVNLISHLVATNPRSRLPAVKVGEKLSMLGGIHQIYHGPKLAAQSLLRAENEMLRKRIKELEGKDETYEARVENARRAHEQDMDRLQALLKEAEERCQRLETEKATRRKNASHENGRQHAPRAVLPGAKRNGAAAATPSAGLGLVPAHTTPMKPGPERPEVPPGSSSKSTPQMPTGKLPVAATRIISIETPQRSPAGPQAGNYTARRTSSVVSISQLCHRGSRSKLPLPVTPNRSETPKLRDDLSMTDSSMSSSVFSRRSTETAPTPAIDSPQLRRTPKSAESEADQRWSRLPARPTSPQNRRPLVASQERVASPSPVRSPGQTLADTFVHSPRMLDSDIILDAVDANSTARPGPPSLQPMKSWADVVKVDKPRRAAQRS
ncbi:hypothetical protein RJ55_03780 [Drechmeria coniospora]|nr:hypothetical protein RJ55_03780 [Drechmeria coniospora]